MIIFEKKYIYKFFDKQINDQYYSEMLQTLFFIKI